MKRLARALFPHEEEQQWQQQQQQQQQQQPYTSTPYSLAQRVAVALDGPVVVQKGALDGTGVGVDVVCSRSVCVAVRTEGTVRRIGGQVRLAAVGADNMTAFVMTVVMMMAVMMVMLVVLMMMNMVVAAEL
jgi:hypothetical protein